nr:MAG TPA: hypothetical protein [Caudoviricetes sp.]
MLKNKIPFYSLFNKNDRKIKKYLNDYTINHHFSSDFLLFCARWRAQRDSE